MDKDKLKAFADKVFGDMAGAMTAGMGYIGVKTGLFRAMAGKGANAASKTSRARPSLCRATSRNGSRA